MSGEGFRGGVHFSAGILFGSMGLWNLMQWLESGKRHHAVNTLLYLPMAGVEGYQTWRHWRREHVSR